MGGSTEQGMFAEERKSRIIEFINKNEKATVTQLCDKFDVSRATIRNDLNELDEKGLIKRTHGGAISTQSVNYEMNFVDREILFQGEKEAVARQALQYIREGDCIGLDAGTTTYELAKLLTEFSRLTIVTYDLNIAAFLDSNTEHAVFLAGGEIRKHFHYLTGEAALRTLQDLYLDVLFLAGNGVDAVKGLTTPNLDTARIKKCLIANSMHKVLLADHSKINNVSFTKYADVSEIDVFITDTGADKKSLKAIEEKDVEVVTVEAGN